MRVFLEGTIRCIFSPYVVSLGVKPGIMTRDIDGECHVSAVIQTRRGRDGECEIVVAGDGPFRG
jgi:hypothetical protein